MARTKHTGRRLGTMIKPYVHPIRKQHHAMAAAKSSVKHAVVSRVLLQPIQNFRIPVTKAELSMDEWNACAPQRIYYGVPEVMKYDAGDTSQLEYLRVPAMKNRRLVGYVPLPIKYQSSWVYLCHCVEYWLAVWKCWDGELKTKKKTKAQKERSALIATSRRNAGARFLEAMVARRTVLEECMANGVNDGRITSLDEFLIRDSRDWLFTEFEDLPEDADRFLEADPLHAANEELFETGWGVGKDDIPLMLGQADNAWMSEGLDVSKMFKKGMNAALKNLKDGGSEVQITHDENAALPDRWHESHEPPIRFNSERKDRFLRDGFALDQPLIFLYHCLRSEEGIERADFLREVMDMFPTDETRHLWELHVNRLTDGKMTWDEFSDLVADQLDLAPDARANNIGPDVVEPESPFLSLDAHIAVRAYLRNLQNKPDAAADLLLQTISRFSDPDGDDLEMWDWVMETVKPDTVSAVLQKAQDRRSKTSNGRRDIAVDRTRIASPDVESSFENRVSNIIDDHAGDTGSDGSPEVTMTSNTIVHMHVAEQPLGPAGDLPSDSANTQEDQTSMTPNAPLGHTSDTVMESQDGMHTSPNLPSHQISQFTAAHDEDVQSTSEDHSIPESLFSLAEVQRAINSFSNDGISFNELRNILLTDTPVIHAQTVREAIQTLNPCRVDIKILDALLEKLQQEELSAFLS